MNQQHLDLHETVNLGSYYTPQKFVETCYDFIQRHVKDIGRYVILDSSCGYGPFLNEDLLKPKRFVGSDIDAKALHTAQKRRPRVTYVHRNSLREIHRRHYHLRPHDKLIIVGNPPYNDKTSLVQRALKTKTFSIDSAVAARDLGMSFLLSYARLQADYVCVLHPLSYLIKETNFKTIRPFTTQYRLIDALILSSQVFQETSHITGFPIILALYQKEGRGMSYAFIKTYRFTTDEGRSFCLQDYDTIDRYIPKYPNQKTVSLSQTVAHFWTMRDINALRRNRTFVEHENAHTIRVSEEHLDYYCYVDVFKRYATHVPYTFGNCNVLLNHQEYQKVKKAITHLSMRTHRVLRKTYGLDAHVSKHVRRQVEDYFKNLLGEHYMERPEGG